MSGLKERVFEVLPHVMRPSRYLPPIHNGRAVGSERAEVFWTLLFPDAAEVGYPHHGTEILYHILNGLDGCAAERAFSPWIDMEREMRNAGIPLFTSESYRPVGTSDILGITLQYELSCTNVLAAVDLAGLHLRAVDRDEALPLVVGGGPCAMNPEPLAPFFDLFVLGDGEATVVFITEAVRAWKREGGSKPDLLGRLARIEGVYVPSRRGAGGDGAVASRAVVADLKRFPPPDSPLVPPLMAIHDRVYSEIARGCRIGCRFCQAVVIYRPMRERTAESLAEHAFASIGNTGYEDISLASLSTGDHSEILSLLRRLNRGFAGRQVGISLPSLRVTTLTDEVITEIARYRKTGFTIAPEAGSERMLRLINKDIRLADVVPAAVRAVENGWDLLKLYFMIGLPTETDEDVDGIASLTRAVWDAGRKISRRKFRLNVSVATLVPKAHTPFQWERQNSVEEIERKQQRIRDLLPRGRNLVLKFHDPRQTWIEGVLARGDKRIAPAIEHLVLAGSRFAGWSECFDPNEWRDAFDACGIDTDDYLAERREEEPHPWAHIDSGTSRVYLLRERGRALTSETTPPCVEPCRSCGVCGDTLTLIRSDRSTVAEPPPPDDPPSLPEARHRIRFRFTKGGDFRFLSHLEIGRVFRLALRRSGLPIAYTQGFHPHVRIGFGPALPVGFAGESELVDFLFSSMVDPGEAERKMNTELPPGIALFEGVEVPLSSRALDALPFAIEYDVLLPDEADREELERRVKEFLAREEVPGEKYSKGKVRTVNLREGVVDARVTDSRLLLSCVSGVRPVDVLLHLCGGDKRLARSLTTRRVSMEVRAPAGQED